MRKLLLATLLAFPLFAAAQYPSKPVRAVVAFGTGGTTDVTARIVAAAMSQSLGQHVPFDPIADFTPIGSIGNFAFFWTVNNDLPIKNLKELAAYGRANPGKLNAGSSGAAATMAPTAFAHAEKFDLQVINYKSETT